MPRHGALASPSTAGPAHSKCSRNARLSSVSVSCTALHVPQALQCELRAALSRSSALGQADVALSGKSPEK